VVWLSQVTELSTVMVLTDHSQEIPVGVPATPLSSELPLLSSVSPVSDAVSRGFYSVAQLHWPLQYFVPTLLLLVLLLKLLLQLLLPGSSAVDSRCVTTQAPSSANILFVLMPTQSNRHLDALHPVLEDRFKTRRGCKLLRLHYFLYGVYGGAHLGFQPVLIRLHHLLDGLYLGLRPSYDG
jgi:hypothetical protein